MPSELEIYKLHILLMKRELETIRKNEDSIENREKFIKLASQFRYIKQQTNRLSESNFTLKRNIFNVD